ncbi:MAG TPA: signal peptidase II [Candidatus Limnocylindrales bacterium]|nr:signal peptidase II [Candidatus Limnocylindrales bacterium]
MRRPASSFARRVLSALERHRFLAALVAADVASKVAAFHFLPDGRAVTLLPGVRLYLAVNEWGVMGGVEGIGRVTANPAYTVLLAAGLIVFAGAIVRLSASSIAFGWQVFAGLLVFLGVAFAAQAIAAPLSHIPLPASMIVATIRLAVLAVSLAFYFASSAPIARAAFTLLAAGSLSNAVSYVYPPYEVVDFLIVPLGSLSDGASFGVINFADIYLFLFPLMLLAWPASALISRRLRTRTALG